MENTEEIFHYLEEFAKRKTKTIPQELNDYLTYVARTGDPVYQWALVKSLFKEKLLNVITDFYETTPGIDIPSYPNVDPFNYDIMKNSLLERLDSFTAAPFTVQRICELLTNPRKQYNRIDKFMRAVEKNILVVSTREPGPQRHIEQENGEPLEPIVNGSDNNSEYNVDVEMEDLSWKDNHEQQLRSEPQPSSSDTHISVDDIETRLHAKQIVPTESEEEASSRYESVTPPELNMVTEDIISKDKLTDPLAPEPTASITPEENKIETATLSTLPDEVKTDMEPKPEVVRHTELVIPEIKIDDAEMTEQKLLEQPPEVMDEPQRNDELVTPEKDPLSSDIKMSENAEQKIIDENSSDSNIKEETELKVISEVLTSSEESSSSSDNTDGNSNSPKTDIETQIDTQEESNQSDSNPEDIAAKSSEVKEPELPVETNASRVELQPDNYSISDVNSEIPQQSSEGPNKELQVPENVKKTSEEPKIEKEETKSENTEMSTEERENDRSLERNWLDSKIGKINVIGTKS